MGGSQGGGEGHGVVVKHTAYYALARGLPGLLAFVALATFTRLLSPEDYGLYVLVLGWVGLLHAIGFQWLRSGLVRFLPAYPSSSPALRSTVIVAFLGVVGASTLLGATAALIAPEGTRVWIGLGTVLLCALAWFDLNQNLAAGTRRPVRYGVLTAARSAVFLVLGVTAARAGWGGGGLVSAAAAAYVVPTLWTVRTDWAGVRLRYAERVVFRRILRYGLPLSASVGLTFVFGYSDRVLVGELVGVAEAGLYAAGYDLAEQALALLIVVSTTAAFPLAAAAFEAEGGEAARAHLRQHVVVLAALLVPAALGLVMLAPEVANVLLGPAFAPTATVVVPWVALSMLVGGFKTAYLDFAFQLGGRTRRLIAVASVAAVVNVGLTVWWLARFGPVGAAYATFASYTVAAAMSWAWGRSVFPLPFPGSDLGRVAAASALMVLVLAPLPPLLSVGGLGLKVATGAAVYVGGAVALDVLSVRTRGIAKLRRPPQDRIP